MEPPHTIGKELTEEQRASVQRLLGSGTFSRAPRLKALLGFVIETWLQGRTESLTEQSIGSGVFGRSPGYQGPDDNIVRVSVRNLRSRLEEYYRTEGVGERWQIQIPKGAYVPTLVVRESTVPPPPPSPGPSLERPELPSVDPPVLPSSPDGAQTSGRLGLWPSVAAVLGLLGLALVVYVRADQGPPTRTGFIPQLFAHTEDRVNLVVVDSSLQYYRELTNRQPLLSEYAEHTLGNGPGQSPGVSLPPQLRQYFSHAHDTSLSSLLTVAQLTAPLPAHRLQVRHPRDMNVRDFQRDHSILLGGPWINPWGQMFEDRFSLRMVAIGHASSSAVQNLQPASGERPMYVPLQDGVKELHYARVALTRNLGGSGKILLLGATSGSALEASAGYLTSPASASDVAARLRRSVEALDALEMLLEVESYQGTPKVTRLLFAREPPRRR